MIDWNQGSKADFVLVAQICKRAYKLLPDAKDLNMDIMATHISGCPLRLQELLDADDGNFLHDISGIHHHLDRETGKLLDCFLPRYTA